MVDLVAYGGGEHRPAHPVYLLGLFNEYASTRSSRASSAHHSKPPSLPLSPPPRSPVCRVHTRTSPKPTGRQNTVPRDQATLLVSPRLSPRPSSSIHPSASLDPSPPPPVPVDIYDHTCDGDKMKIYDLPKGRNVMYKKLEEARLDLP